MGDAGLDQEGRNGDVKNMQKGNLDVDTRHEHSIWHIAEPNAYLLKCTGKNSEDVSSRNPAD